MFERILNGLAMSIIFAFSVLGIILPIYAAVVDIQADRIGYGIANLVVPPMGIIRGILLFFGWV